MSLIDRDLACNWHPCMQMKDYEIMPPVHVVAAKGVWIETANGQRLLDSGSSWWCKALGHSHPALVRALQQQSEAFDHVLFTNLTYESVVDLSEQLKALLPGMSHVRYASDGSSAVEMALKLAVHAQALSGHKQRNRFASLSGAYHGETGLALSVSANDRFSKHFHHLLCPSIALSPMPYVTGLDDPLWCDASAVWQQWEAQLAPYQDTLAAIIVEPVVQAANHLQIYSADALRRLASWAKAHGIYMIIDEVMSGFWRTGRCWAHQHAEVEPDFVCLGKALGGGMLPISAMLTTKAVFDLCYDDYHAQKAFLHSHTHSGNALAVAVARASVQLLSDPAWQARTQALQAQMRQAMLGIAQRTGRLENVRGVGAIMVADLILSDQETQDRASHRIAQVATSQGVLMRPLGRALYWVPPLIIEASEVALMAEVTEAAIVEVLGALDF